MTGHPPRAPKTQKAAQSQSLTEFAFVRKTARSVERKHKTGGSLVGGESPCVPPKRALAPLVPVVTNSSSGAVVGRSGARARPGAEAKGPSAAKGPSDRPDRALVSGRRVLGESESRHLNAIVSLVQSLVLSSALSSQMHDTPRHFILLSFH